MVSTLLWCPVYIWSELPQDERTCCRVPLADLHIAQGSSVKPDWKDKAMGSIAISKAFDSFLASAPSQFIHAHCLAWPAVVASSGGQSGHSLLLLDHVEFSDDHVSTAPAVLTVNLSKWGTSWASLSSLSDSNDLFVLETGIWFLQRFSSWPLGSSSNFRLYLPHGVIWWVPNHNVEPSFSNLELLVRRGLEHSHCGIETNCWEGGGTPNHLWWYLLMCLWKWGGG